MNIPNYDFKVILASASPRRAEILRLARVNFEIQATNIDESLVLGEDPSQYVIRLATSKARAITSNDKNTIVIAADTVVVLDGEILTKPKDTSDAYSMLKRLSGCCHQVLTGVAVWAIGNNILHSACEYTNVWFDSLTEDWITWYINSGEPMDKAGAYAIQGAASVYVNRIEGNYLNIVGLPMSLVWHLLENLEVKI